MNSLQKIRKLRNNILNSAEGQAGYVDERYLFTSLYKHVPDLLITLILAEGSYAQWRANMMARCGSCHTKKSCFLRIYPQRYTFRSDLRWQADKQRKHQN